ncbi:Alpha-1,3-mannosyl-glycoprotein 2-beta-N-acetylglucosaminyltransferase [Trichinella britovi]|uniref:Alpha-1,3-mannosyl-glycoprotein 2-beta-N-acetylglucosaminyltransferase n=1 Tax=Trichinella britovi TaxID=45882 RepID=A0A0V1CDB7_TRIBR|nr:Alpha-1,3-mannosyl-glycoprotein 2-beta-N-acetylglucosaminyltransferase [Trichinella britovi]
MVEICNQNLLNLWKKNGNPKTYFNNCCKRFLTAFGRLHAITSTAICCNGILVKFTERLFTFSSLCLNHCTDCGIATAHQDKYYLPVVWCLHFPGIAFSVCCLRICQLQWQFILITGRTFFSGDYPSAWLAEGVPNVHVHFSFCCRLWTGKYTMNLLRFVSLRHIFFITIIWLLALILFYRLHESVSIDYGKELPKVLNKMIKLEKEIVEQNKEAVRLLERLDNDKFAQEWFIFSNTTDNTAHPDDRDAPLSIGDKIPVLVMACNRPGAIRVHLNQLLLLRPSPELFPIIVSQDCDHQPTAQVIDTYRDSITVIKQPNQTEPILSKKLKKFAGYYKIARHYRWALNQIFFHMKYKTVIVTEDDLQIAVDFFEFFLATYKILIADSSLYCVSAWNDNGQEVMIEDRPDLLYRTDFFPGLGWMLTRQLWKELSPKWPNGFWDDWIRDPPQRRGRSCIRPEISRTAMSLYGKSGVSKGLFYEKHLKSIKLNTKFVHFTAMNLTYLLKENYEKLFSSQVNEAPVVSLNAIQAGLWTGKSVRILYRNAKEFVDIAKIIGLMDDMKAGIPRTAFRGVVPVYYYKTRVFISPSGKMSNNENVTDFLGTTGESAVASLPAELTFRAGHVA